MGIGSLSPVDSGGLRRAVFLDRDGVLNRVSIREGKPYPPATLEEMVILPGVREGLQRLHKHGFLLVGATNQPDVARGLQRRDVIEAMNARLVAELELDDMRVCWHDDRDGCQCRKPKPGLLIAAAETHRIALPLSYMVGDRWRDIEAGQAGGCRTVLMRMPYAERGPRKRPDLVAESFDQVAEWILKDAATLS